MAQWPLCQSLLIMYTFLQDINSHYTVSDCFLFNWGPIWFPQNQMQNSNRPLQEEGLRLLHSFFKRNLLFQQAATFSVNYRYVWAAVSVSVTHFLTKRVQKTLSEYFKLKIAKIRHTQTSIYCLKKDPY